MATFDKVDLGTNKTMQRLVKAEQDKRRAIIAECAAVAFKYSEEAGNALLRLQMEEQDE